MENDKLVRLSHAISAAKTGADDWDGGCNLERDRYIEKAFDSIPAVDAVEVVRCPSCRYHTDDGYHECIQFGIRIPDDAEFFCKYGKRREEAGT